MFYVIKKLGRRIEKSVRESYFPPPRSLPGGLESVRIQCLPILEEIGKCQNWKVLE